MKNKNKKPELMSPIKTRAGLKAATPFADAVYFGVSDLNLRAGSKGIGTEELVGFVKECHREEVKAYLTVNSILYDSDLNNAETLIRKAKEAEVDAVIVWDPAAIEIARDVGVDFFISTQASVSNSKAVDFYERSGAKRVILARELSLRQIKEIRKKTSLELEIFIHGAMCLAISGRCTLSGFFENSSANRGACNQLCRRRWKIADSSGNEIETDGRYYLSPKDICMVEHIPELIEAGVDSFKIEGRQRNPRYVRVVTEIYRKAIDDYFSGSFSKEKAKKWKDDLSEVYNREFSTGFYFGIPGPEGISFDSSGSAATVKRVLTGKVVHYYPEPEVAVLKLQSGLSRGDRFVIEGETTFLEGQVESMEIEGKKIERAKKGEEIGLKVSGRAREGDNFFILLE